MLSVSRPSLEVVKEGRYFEESEKFTRPIKGVFLAGE